MTKHHRRGAIAEDDGEPRCRVRALVGFRSTPGVGARANDVPVGPRHEAGVHLGADQQDGLRRLRLNEAVGELKRVRHGGALLPDVEGRHAFDAELLAEQRAGPREEVVGSHRGEDDVVDVFARDAGVLDGALARGRRRGRSAPDRLRAK